MSSLLDQEIKKRRSFAIISHPDAGKTTLTEFLLLHGGAIHLSGQVKAKGQNRRARSDWMKMEQERGISISTSVMTFFYRDHVINLLDTPGHEDFSEDTYRTLTAVDSAVMVIDAARGIEAQTRKLFEVCRLRNIPIITFINKIDRDMRPPLELMDEIADQLQLDVHAVTYPLGMGNDLRGCYHFWQNVFLPFQPGITLTSDEEEELAEQTSLLQEAGTAFDQELYRAGHLTPVLFGTALKNYGIDHLLNLLISIAPPPQTQPAIPDPIAPNDPRMTGFVFKVQANMDKNHRDRIAFLRVSSGNFQRGMKLRQSSTGKTLAVHNPIFFFAQERELAQSAYAGDVIGIPNHGTLRVGDCLFEGNQPVHITGIPRFAPEILQRIRSLDPLKAKHLQKALIGLSEEGVTQIFRPMTGGLWIIGVVGQLQLEVIAQRLKDEYQLDVEMDAAPFVTARWLHCKKAGQEEKNLRKKLRDTLASSLAEDGQGDWVILPRNHWELGHITENWPDFSFMAVKEHDGKGM